MFFQNILWLFNHPEIGITPVSDQALFFKPYYWDVRTSIVSSGLPFAGRKWERIVFEKRDPDTLALICVCDFSHAAAHRDELTCDGAQRLFVVFAHVSRD